MNDSTCRRKKFLVEDQIQMSVAKRVTGYGVIALLFVLLTLTFWNTYVIAGGSFTQNLYSTLINYSPFFAFMGLFIPFAVYDSICLTHKIAGPIFRMRSDLAKHKQDKSVRIRLRKGDMLQVLPDQINGLLGRIAELENQVDELQTPEVPADALV